MSDIAEIRHSALDHLFNGSKQWFVDNGYGEIVAFGRKALTHQINQLPAPHRAGRVIYCPGDDTGKAGKLVAPRTIGQRPRQIYGWDELAEIHIWGRDFTAGRDDELAHYRVTVDLYEAVVRALRSLFAGRVELGEANWTLEPSHLFGCEITQLVVLHGGLFDASPAVISKPSFETESAMEFPPPPNTEVPDGPYP